MGALLSRSPLTSQPLPTRAWGLPQIHQPTQRGSLTLLPTLDRAPYAQGRSGPFWIRMPIQSSSPKLVGGLGGPSSRKPFLTAPISESLKLFLPAMCPSLPSHACTWALVSFSRAGSSTAHAVVLWDGG